MGSSSAPRKIGRPKFELDPKQANIFGYFRATYETMAGFLGCHYDTIRRAMQDENSEFSKAYKKGSSSLKMKLSEAQIKHGLAGNASLLIWLGKQYLGQRDNPDINDDSTPAIVDLVPTRLAATDDDLDETNDWATQIPTTSKEFPLSPMAIS